MTKKLEMRQLFHCKLDYFVTDGINCSSGLPYKKANLEVKRSQQPRRWRSQGRSIRRLRQNLKKSRKIILEWSPQVVK